MNLGGLEIWLKRTSQSLISNVQIPVFFCIHQTNILHKWWAGCPPWAAHQAHAVLADEPEISELVVGNVQIGQEEKVDKDWR